MLDDWLEHVHHDPEAIKRMVELMRGLADGTLRRETLPNGMGIIYDNPTTG